VNELEEIKKKKEVLNFIKIYPKDVKAVLDFSGKLIFIVDENKELFEKINEIFNNSSIIPIEELVEGLYDGNPLYIRIIEDGKVLFDIGLIKSFKNLMNKGKIKPSKQAIYHSFLKALKQRDEVFNHGKAMVANMFWALYYLLQSYLMVKEKYLTPKEMLELLKIMSEAGKMKKEVYLVYDTLYNLYFYIHNYNLEDLEFLLKNFEEVFGFLKKEFEKEFNN